MTVNLTDHLSDQLTDHRTDRRPGNPIAALRRQVRGLALALLATLCAALGQNQLYAHALGRPVALPLVVILFGLAAYLVFRATATFAGAPGPDDAARPIVASDLRRSPARWLGPAAIAANLVALALLAAGVQLNLAWAIYVASMVGAVATAYVLDPPKRRGVVAPWLDRPRREVVALGAILLLAAFFRFDRLADLPVGLWFDSANQGLVSERILHDPGFRPIWITGDSPDPALRMYWQALLFLFIGPTNLALRLIPAAAGLLCVLAAYLLARELFGWRTGLVAAALVAVGAWNVTLSRINLSGIWSAALDTLAAYLLVRALRTGRRFEFGLAGFVLGLGINSYYTSYLFTVVLAALAVSDLVREKADRAAIARGLAVTALVLAVTVSPLAEFATLHRDEYTARMNQVSIRQEIAQAHSLAPVEESLVAHLLMFNYAGDRNGRHNLSGWPELDPLTGAFFLLGLVICLRLARRPSYTLPVVALGVILLGGVLAVSFEAPQSVRTVDNSVFAAIIAAVPLAFLWERLAELRLGRVDLPLGRLGVASFSTGALLAIGLLGCIAVLNYQRYFVLQANSNSSYAENSTAPTLLAQTMNALGHDYDVYMSETYVGQPTIQFVAPWINPERPFDAATTLPLRSGQNVAIFLEGRDSPFLNALHLMYPGATYREYRLSPNDPILMYGVFVPRDQVAALNGLDAAYYRGAKPSGTPSVRQLETSASVNWLSSPPLPPPFVADWTGGIVAPSFGSYQFRLDGPSDAILKIDARQAATAGQPVGVTLAAGPHQLEIVAPFQEPGALQLEWAPPGQTLQAVPGEFLFHGPAIGHGLLASYYPNNDWSGQPALEQVAISPSSYFHLLPLAQPFSVSWTGKIDVPQAGVYHFGTQSRDGSWLFVDGRAVVNNGQTSDQYVEGAVPLTAGLHDLEIRFQDHSGFSFLDAYWQTPAPGATREPLPTDRLYPATLAAVVPLPPQAQQLAGRPPLNPVPAAAVSPAALDALRALSLTELTDFEAQARATPLAGPRGVVVDAAGDVYVVDTGDRRVVALDPSGKLIRTLQSDGASGAALDEPVAAVVGPDGNLVVLDSANGWLNRFSPAGAFLGKFGGPSVGFYHPRGLAVDADGHFLVADTGGSQIVEFNADGSLLARLGGKDRGPGNQAFQPVGVAADAQGTIYVTDAANAALARYDQHWNLLQKWSLPSFASNTGDQILAAPDGTLLVTDPSNHRILRLDQRGSFVGRIVGPLERATPVGLARDAAGHLYVADPATNQIYAFDSSSG